MGAAHREHEYAEAGGVLCCAADNRQLRDRARGSRGGGCQPHRHGTLTTDPVQSPQQVGVSVDAFGSWLAFEPEVSRTDHDNRRAGIDQGGGDGVFAVRKIVAGLTRREEPASSPPRRVDETHPHRRSREGHPGNHGVGLLDQFAVGGLQLLDDDLSGVGVEHSDGGDRIGRAHPPFANGEGCDDRRAVAAVAAPVHRHLIDADLREGVVDVDIRIIGRVQDDRLAGGGAATPDAVDLAMIGAAEDPQEHLIAGQAGNVQVLAAKDPALAGAAAHPRGANLSHFSSSRASGLGAR